MPRNWTFSILLNLSIVADDLTSKKRFYVVKFITMMRKEAFIIQLLSCVMHNIVPLNILT